MGRGRNRGLGDIIPIAAAIVSIFVLYMFFQQGYGASLGLSATLPAELMLVFPGMVIVVFSCIAIARGGGGPTLVGGFGALGVGTALLLGELYSGGIIDTLTLGGASLSQVQTIIIVVCTLLGGVIYATHHR